MRSSWASTVASSSCESCESCAMTCLPSAGRSGRSGAAARPPSSLPRSRERRPPHGASGCAGDRGASWPYLQSRVSGRAESSGRRADPSATAGRESLAAAAGGTEPRHHGALPARVVELVEAAVAPFAEDLEHVLTPAAVALSRPRRGGVHGFSLGVGRAIASATASGLKRPSSSTQRRASSCAWARNAWRRATKSPKRSAIRWCVPAAPPSAALARAPIDRKPATSAARRPARAGSRSRGTDRRPGRPGPPRVQAVLQARHLKWGISPAFARCPQASIHDNLV